MERYLNILLRILGADVIRRLVILGADCQDCKEDGQPRCRDRLRRLAGFGGITGSVLEVNHEIGLELVDIQDKAPEGLRNLFVSAEEPVELVSMRRI